MYFADSGGNSAATAGGYLGGHLVYRQGVGADRNAWKHGGDDWVDVSDDAPGLPAQPPLRLVFVGGLVRRSGRRTRATIVAASHAGCPRPCWPDGPDTG